MPSATSRLAGRAFARLGSASTSTRRYLSDRNDTQGNAWQNVRRILRELRGEGEGSGPSRRRDGQGVGAGAGEDGQGPSTQSQSPADFPSFLAFFSSRYALALIVLTLVINRIHATVHVNIPYRSSAKVRSICRLPAIVLLTRACLLLVGMMVRMNEYDQADALAKGYRYYYSVRSAIEVDNQVSHADVLWSCFVASCVACANESFIRALDHE